MIAALDLHAPRCRLAPAVRQAVRADTRRIVITGARGWIGRTAIAVLRDALGERDFTHRVRCFGSAAGMIEPGVPQQALSTLRDLPAEPTLLLHLAFLTKDKVAGMDAAAYAAANRAISDEVHAALDCIGVDRLFLASSGAAAFADDPQAAADLRLYGALKRDDEDHFASWASADRRVAIGRLYSLSGPWMNKHETYALASFILDALAGRPIAVRAPMAVHRSYVPVRELLSLVFAALLADDADPVLRFDTGGAPLELAAVAQMVARVLGGSVDRHPITDNRSNIYVGDDANWQALLARHGLTPLPLPDQIAETADWLRATSSAVEAS
jgi:nucleoside-diphosphate-sugar epimerase